ncbi:MAG: CapA family protein [Bdellovibrionales bacterium]|nr:CapA family protein [Bdellovibrionales bacterium]
MLKTFFILIIFLITQSQQTLANNCSPNEASLLMFGDFLLHKRLQVLALEKNNYAWFFEEIQSILPLADFKTLNLEGPAAAGVNKYGRQQTSVNYFDGNVLTSYPMFNYHESALTAIKRVGFDFVTTANNHSLDRGFLGINRTIEGLEQNQIDFVGTRNHQDSTDQAFIKYVRVKNLKLALISCTEHTNGLPDKKNQVLYCGKNMDLILNLIKSTRQDPTVDGTMVLPHWGVENKHAPEDYQRNWARKFIRAGSFAVIGSHPHVIQNMETYEAINGNKGFIFYSLGNFISGQVKPDQKITLGLLLNISKDVNNQLQVQKVAYIPLYMNSRRHQITPIEDSMKNKLSQNEMDYGKKLLTSLLGSKYLLNYSAAIKKLENCQF